MRLFTYYYPHLRWHFSVIPYRAYRNWLLAFSRVKNKSKYKAYEALPCARQEGFPVVTEPGAIRWE